MLQIGLLRPLAVAAKGPCLATSAGHHKVPASADTAPQGFVRGAWCMRWPRTRLAECTTPA